MSHGNRWNGGKWISSQGYMMHYIPDHPRMSRGYVREHIVLAEKALGKPLPDKVVVHHHGERSDNTQLVVCQNQKYHMLLHMRTRALSACGHASWRMCKYCREYDKPENLYVGSTGTVYHRSCRNDYGKQRRDNVKTKERNNR